MRNKRTLQRGLSLLLAGGMALSSVGVTPVLAEEYTPAAEVTQTDPEEEAPLPEENVTDTTASEDTDLSESSESTSATEKKVESSGSAAEEHLNVQSSGEDITAEENADAESPEENTDADQSVDVFDMDEINDIATYAADTEVIADGMSKITTLPFSTPLTLNDKQTNKTDIYKFDKLVTGQSKVQLSFDWTPNIPTSTTKAGIEFRDSGGCMVFALLGCRTDNKTYQLRYATTGADSISSQCEKVTVNWVTLETALKTNTKYHIDATADFTTKKLQLKITDSSNTVVANVTDADITAHDLAKLVNCSYYIGGSAATQTVDNFKIYGNDNALSFPLEGKTIVAFGDSIVAGHQYTAASFVNFVAEKEGMTVLQKNAVNGATIMNANYSGGRILTQIQNASASTPDYVIFDGGTNDAEYLTKNSNVQIGEANSTDEATFTGSFRATIQALKTKYPNAKLVYVAVHKMKNEIRSEAVQKELHEMELAICGELGVTVANIYDDTTLDANDTDMRSVYSFDSVNSTTGLPQPGANGSGSGTHPNFKAIEEFYIPTVSKALRSAQNATTEPEEPDEPVIEYNPSIDFAQVTDLNDETQMHGWTYSNGGGSVTLVDDAEKGKVLKIDHSNANSNTVELSYDALDIQESETPYVTVAVDVMLGTDAHSNQFCLPYISNSAGKYPYAFLVNGDWSTYKAHIQKSGNIQNLGAVTPGTWQQIRIDIDLAKDTFTTSIDGVIVSKDAAAREKTDNLQKIRFYQDWGSGGVIYLASVSVTASDTNPFAPHTTPAKYYVSNSGNDSNDGKSPENAWATIDRVNRETFTAGDEILFERGGEWENTTLQPQGSGIADAYIKIGAYGDENEHMPRISANGKVADALYLYNQEYWEICDLDISNNVEGTTMVAGDTNPTSNVVDRVASEGEKLGDYRGIHIAGHDVATLQGYYIHDVRVHDVSGIVSWIGNTKKYEPGIGNNYGYDASKRTGGILIEAIAPTGDTNVKTGQPTVFSNITIENSEFVNNSFCGITIKQYNNGKNQENGTGWANRNSNNGAPDYYDQYWHPFTNIVIRGNYINQGASAYACNGMYLCGVKDSVVEKNLLENIGTCGIELFFADNVAVQYNDISNVRWKGGGQDANAIDPDWRATNILIQYNYIHDCGEGFLLCGMRCNSGTIRYNLVQDCTSSYIHYSMGGGYFQINNNVFYRSKDGYGTSNFDPWGGGTASYVNNIFYDGKGTGFGFSGGSSFSYYNNAYYGTPACSKDTNPIILTEDPFAGTAPAMSRVGNATTGVLLEANGLIPKTTSALIAAGANKDANGFALTEGMTGKGTKLNYTSLIAAYSDIVPIAATAYPVFEKTGAEAALSTTYTQTAASTTAPTIGMFEIALPEDAVYLRGTVSDDVNACANAKVTVTVGGKTIETTTNNSGVFSITEGLTAGEATVTVEVDGRDTYTKTITLESGKVNTIEVTVPMPAMPNAYSDTLINETFDEDAGALTFNTNATVADGRLALSPGNAASSYADFDEDVQSRTAVDFSFDFQYQNGSNKGGFQFRDSDGHLLFAMCIKTADGGNTMRTAAAASLVGGTEMSEPKWVDHTADYNKTYVVRVHADFEAGTVSYQLKDKATDKVVLQELNIPTNATNLARMYSSNWYQAKTQYIDNFVLTAAAKKPEPIEVDTSKLVEAISEGEKKVETDYTTGSWKDFSDALKAAKDILAKDDATQAEVDAAADALTQAAKNLVAKADTSKLEQAINDNKDKNKDDYTEASWKDFSDALEAAKAVLAKVDPTQAEVDAATDTLNKAAEKLETKPAPVVVDKKALQQAIDAAADKVEEDYTETSWADFAKALADAQTVLDNPDATQAEVDAATDALTKAAKNLETKPAPVVVDKKALQQAIDAAADKVEEDYTEVSWADFAKAFADAQNVYDKADATQEDVDAATKALTDAAAALKVKPTEPPKTETKVDNEPLSDKNIPDSLKEAGYDTPQKIQDKLKQESNQEFASDNLVVYDVTLKVSTDGGKTWEKATAENFPKDGLEVSFDLPEGITAETADQYTFVISHMKDDATVELLTPVLKDGKLTVTVHSLSPFGISWKAKEQPKPTEQPTATPAPTAKPSNSSTTPKATAAPKATDAPKATAAPAAPIPQTADSFPLVMLAVLALCSAAALAGLTICRSKKKH